jgi:cobalt/nickel transport system permease protein
VSGANIVASTLKSLSRALSRALINEQTARQPGVMQALDPRVRVAGTFLLVVAVVLLHQITVLLTLFVAGVVLALASAVTLRTLTLRVWLVVLAFTGVIALPALWLTPGEPLSTFPSITRQGLHTAMMLVLRVETAVTFTTVLVLTTPWAQVLKALRSLGLPKEVIMMLAMAYRYIFLLAETANQMFESRESRRIGALGGREQRRLVAQTAGVLMSKSLDLSQEVFLAMQSRGYRGDVVTLTEQRLTPRDYFGVLAFAGVAALAIWLGR